MPAMGCRQRDHDTGNAMEPLNGAKTGDLKEISPQGLLNPLDAEDYFELACEADEFGVHILSYSVAE